jgi:hypothetical protein
MLLQSAHFQLGFPPRFPFDLIRVLPQRPQDVGRFFVYFLGVDKLPSSGFGV